MDNTFKKPLYRALARLPSSISIAARVLSNVSLQRVLIGNGAGKPIFILYGKPGNGKTSLVRVMLGKDKLGKIKEIKFADGLKEIKKAIKDMKGIGRGDDKEVEIIFLDNYPEALSSYKQETGKRILDYIIDIASEDEEVPLVIITGEPNIINDMEKVESLIGRTLIIKMPKIDDDEELYNIRECFSASQTEYSNLWDDYDRWAKSNPVDEAEVSCELKKFRQKYFGKYEYRQIGLVFCYYYAIGRFSGFMEAEYGEGISMRDVEHNIQELFEWKEASGSDRSSYEVDVWNEFVQDDGIKNVITPRSHTCKLLAECDCNNYYNQYECYRCDGVHMEGYDSMDLRLPEDLCAAILIEKPKLIPNFPRHIVCDSPLLMIRSFLYNTSIGNSKKGG